MRTFLLTILWWAGVAISVAGGYLIIREIGSFGNMCSISFPFRNIYYGACVIGFGVATSLWSHFSIQQVQDECETPSKLELQLSHLNLRTSDSARQDNDRGAVEKVRSTFGNKWGGEGSAVGGLIFVALLFLSCIAWFLRFLICAS